MTETVKPYETLDEMEAEIIGTPFALPMSGISRRLLATARAALAVPVSAEANVPVITDQMVDDYHGAYINSKEGGKSVKEAERFALGVALHGNLVDAKLAVLEDRANATDRWAEANVPTPREIALKACKRFEEVLTMPSLMHRVAIAAIASDMEGDIQRRLSQSPSATRDGGWWPAFDAAQRVPVAASAESEEGVTAMLQAQCCAKHSATTAEAVIDAFSCRDCNRLALEAALRRLALSGSEATETTAWLIERKGRIGEWWDGENWTADANKAVRFVGEEDAKRAMQAPLSRFSTLCLWHEGRASEHIWTDATQGSRVPQEGGGE